MKKNEQIDAHKTGNTLPKNFQSLIPTDAVDGRFFEKISADYLRVRQETANALRTGNPLLASGELARFEENCKFLGAVRLAIQLRNYLLWEIYSHEQFRAEFQSFEEFAKQITGLEKSQVWKSLHSGRIRMAMIGAGLDDVGPTGRQVEELSKIDPEHTVGGWQHTLAYMRCHGRSISIVREALLEYCKVANIPYGKRQPNGSHKLGLPKINRRRKANANSSNVSNTASEQGDVWSLSSTEAQIILKLSPAEDGFEDADCRDNEIARCIGAIKTLVARNSPNKYVSSCMHSFLALVARKHGETAQALMDIAFEKLWQMVGDEIGRDVPPPSAAPDVDSNGTKETVSGATESEPSGGV